jgi:MFS family permease
VAPSPEQTEDRGLSYQGWRVALASATALAFSPSTVAVLSLGLFMRPLEAEFHWTRTEVALATTIISYTVAVVSPLQGYLIDRFGARRVMIPSIPAFALGVAALSLLPPVHWIYYLAWVVIPLLGIGLFPLAYLKVVGGWFEKRLGLALGLTNAGVAVGSMLVPVVAGGLIAAYGWRAAYLGLGAVVLVLTLPVVGMFVREKAAPVEAGIAQPLEGASFGEAVRTRIFALLAAAFVFIGVMNTAMIVHQVPLLIDRGMAPPKAALVQTVFGLFGLFGRLITGLLLDRFPANRVLVAFVLGGAVACGLYGLGAAGNLAFLCAALIGLLFGAEFDVLGYIIKARFGLRAFGKIYGAIFAIFQFGAGFGAAILPMTRDRFGSYGPGLFTFAFLLVLAAVAVAGVGGVKTQRLSDVPA